MISQAIVVNNDKVLMVRQYVQRGDIVWNFPGGGIEVNETPEQACLREVWEETGFIVEIKSLLFENGSKLTYEAEIVGGQMQLDKTKEYNDDVLEVAWIDIEDYHRFDSYTKPIIELYKQRKDKNLEAG